MSNQTGAVATQRLFFALWPEAVLQQRLARAASALLPPDAGRRVPAENLHCTLVFLGAVEPRQRLCLEDVASQVYASRFTLSMDRFGYFRRPQAGWLGCNFTPPALTGLVAALSRGAAACGFLPERRPYAVHLTVARKLRRDPGRPQVLPISWDVSRFALVESLSTAAGVQYRPLRFWDLLAP